MLHVEACRSPPHSSFPESYDRGRMIPQTADPAERRAYPRIPSSLAALVVLPSGAEMSCRIRNFCVGGMLLVMEGKTEPECRLMAKVFRSNRSVSISFDATLGSTPLHLCVEARVAHVYETAIGVAFVNPAAEFLESMRRLAEQLQAGESGSGGVPQSESDRVHGGGGTLDDLIDLSRTLWAKQGEGLVRSVVGGMIEALVQRTGKRHDSAAEALAFRDIATLETLLSRTDLGQAARLSMDRQLSGVGRRGQEHDPSPWGELSLVDKEELESWLAVEAFASRIEASNAEGLDNLSRQMRAVLDPGGALPLGPEMLAAVLHEILDLMDPEPIDRKRLLAGLSRHMATAVHPLYSEFSRRLEALGFLVPPPSPPAPPTHARTQADAHVHTVDGEVGAGTGPAGGLAASGGGRPGGQAPASRQRGSVPAEPHSTDELFQALSRLQRHHARSSYGAVSSARSLKEEVLSALGCADEAEVGRLLGGRVHEQIDTTDRLVNYLSKDAAVGQRTRQWLTRLKIPILKAALSNSGFFQDPRHPTHRIVNQLDHLGQLIGSARTDAERTSMLTIERLIERLLGAADQDQNVPVAVSAALSGLEAEHSRAYQRKVQRVVAASVGNQRVSDAQAAVRRELVRRFDGRRIHRLLAALLDDGWVAWLELIHIEQGPDSAGWEQGWQVVDRLDRLLAAGQAQAMADPPDTDALLKEVAAGLGRASFDPVQRGRLFDALSQRLASTAQRSAGAQASDYVLYRPASRPPGPAEEGAPARPGDLDEVSWTRALERVGELQVGDPVRIKDKKGLFHPLRIAWIAPSRRRFMLVDQGGRKTRELSLGQLARALARRLASAAAEPGKPLLDRASTAMLREMGEGLAYHATHDPMTGLYNRRHLLKTVDGILKDASAAGTDATHVLCLVDLDQFKLINNICGYQAGDQLLRVVADRLRARFQVSATVAHMGGDEFVVFLALDDPEGVAALGERVHATIKAVPFAWGDAHFPIDASIGLVRVQGNYEDAAAVLKAADSACMAAKKGGRNRIQIYREDDSEIVQQRHIMHWVVRVNEALDHDRLVLRCQRIAPVDPAAGHAGHYEILLTVNDEGGQPMVLEDFIRAAENYNRMATVDRWVIEHTLSWVARNPLAARNGYAINLSGHSLNDEGLVDYVREQFERSGVAPDHISFEVTETVAIANLERAASVIESIKGLGCAFALDDFGSGLSSYSYLSNLPVDLLKIDGAFVRNIVDNPNDYAVVKSINEIGHFMGKRTIAEYVENAQILECLREIGVDYAQGYGIEKPRLLEDLAKAPGPLRVQP